MEKRKKLLKELNIDDFLGYVPLSIVKEQMYAKDYKKFDKFMSGQTMRMFPKNEVIIYASDLRNFLEGRPIWD